MLHLKAHPGSVEEKCHKVKEVVVRFQTTLQTELWPLADRGDHIDFEI